jgi:uncharacterized protein YegL
MRRLPVYILVDTSGSMKGEPIESVNAGINMLISALRQDPFALETVYLSFITFDKDINIILGLTPLEEAQDIILTTPESGPTHLGKALQDLCKSYDKDIIKTTKEIRGDWKPLLFIMTDGAVSDLFLFKEMVSEIHKREFGQIILCAAGPKAEPKQLRLLSNNVFCLDTMNSSSFSNFFKWVSTTVSEGSRSLGANQKVDLPKPPDEIKIY